MASLFSRSRKVKDDFSDAVKSALTAERLAQYCDAHFGHGFVTVSGEYRVGKGSRAASNSGLTIQDKDDGAFWYDHSEARGGDCFNLIWWLDFDGQTDKIPPERFTEVLAKAAEIAGVDRARLDFAQNRHSETQNAAELTNHTSAAHDAQKEAYDAFIGLYWETLRSGLDSVQCENLFRLRGLGIDAIKRLENIGYTWGGVKKLNVSGLKFLTLNRSLISVYPL